MTDGRRGKVVHDCKQGLHARGAARAPPALRCEPSTCIIFPGFKLVFDSRSKIAVCEMQDARLRGDSMGHIVR